MFALPVADTGDDWWGCTPARIVWLGTPPVISRLTCTLPENSVPANERAEKPIVRSIKQYSYH